MTKSLVCQRWTPGSSSVTTFCFYLSFMFEPLLPLAYPQTQPLDIWDHFESSDRGSTTSIMPYESFWSVSPSHLRFSRPFLGLNVHSLRILSLVLAHLLTSLRSFLRFAHISAHSRFGRSLCTFSDIFVLHLSTFSDFGDFYDDFSSGRVHIFP